LGGAAEHDGDIRVVGGGHELHNDSRLEFEAGVDQQLVQALSGFGVCFELFDESGNEPLLPARKGCLQQFLPIGEVMVEPAFGDAYPAGDGLYRHRPDASLGDLG